MLLHDAVDRLIDPASSVGVDRRSFASARRLCGEANLRVRSDAGRGGVLRRSGHGFTLLRVVTRRKLQLPTIEVAGAQNDERPDPKSSRFLCGADGTRKRRAHRKRETLPRNREVGRSDPLATTSDNPAIPGAGSKPDQFLKGGRDASDDPVEAALATALQGATQAGEWSTVAQLARDLEERRKARAGVVELDVERERRRR